MKLDMENHKGITMISLIITIAILAIITYVSVSIGIGITGDVKFQNIETYMLLIQSKCEALANEKIIENLDDSSLYGTLQEEGDYAGWYKLSQAELNEIGVKDAKAEDGYYVNYYLNDKNKEVDVAYARGVTYHDEVFYLLSSISNYVSDDE